MENSQDKSLGLSNAGYSQSMMTMHPEQSRIVAEVQGAIVVAQHCPRNEQKAYTEILNACKRPALAEAAIYSFPRGGQVVSGPSIRLAEVVARLWGNLQYGIREITTNENETKYEAFCWDMQNNVRASRVFTQSHGRWTKRAGFTQAEDPRDVYEIVANAATRRLRACILEIVPADIVDSAIETCEKTLAGKSEVPIKDRINKMVSMFDSISVSQEMLEKHLRHKLEVTSEVELIQLGKIYRSIVDGMSVRQDYFDLGTTAQEDVIAERFADKDPTPETKTVKGKKEA